jgi:hypothetical protein
MKQITNLDESRLTHFANELFKQHESEKMSSYEKDFPVEEFFMVTNTLPNVKTHSGKQNSSLLSTWTRVVGSKSSSLQETKKSCDAKPTKKTFHSETATVEKRTPLVVNYKENRKSVKSKK